MLNKTKNSIFKVPRKISSDLNDYILTVVKSEIIINKIDNMTRTVLSISSAAEVIFKRKEKNSDTQMLTILIIISTNFC